MAEASSPEDQNWFLRSVLARGLASHMKNEKARYTEGQVEAIRIVTCCIAGLSFLAACICLYWLLRMKRSFRHM